MMRLISQQWECNSPPKIQHLFVLCRGDGSDMNRFRRRMQHFLQPHLWQQCNAAVRTEARSGGEPAGQSLCESEERALSNRNICIPRLVGLALWTSLSTFAEGRKFM